MKKLSPAIQGLVALLCVGNAVCGPSLVPESSNLSPDYFCTWNIQGYVCSYESGEAQRRAMTEANMFGDDRHQRWVDFFPKVRKDLIFVMDDSWDIPLNEDKAWFGSAVLNEERFPSYTGSPAERLRKLTDAVKAAGWRGLGGWICAQRAPKFEADDSEDAYWSQRLEWMRDADFTYWKVDWGKHDHDAEWRHKLTDLGRKIAPHTVIEHALAERSIDFADVYRTYDIENVISAPVTIDRIAKLLEQSPKDSPTLINCEDEPYIAAGTGSAIGVMRHPFAGPLPNGKQDFVFPPNSRDLKHRLDEVTRAIRWHRIAAPIPLGATGAKIDSKRLDDHWILEKDETYTPHKIGDRRDASAPARISRGLDLPEVKMSHGEEPPFGLVSKSANGAVAIATIGRATGRKYVTPKARVTLNVGDTSGPIGIFGVYDSLTLRFDKVPVRVLAQDLASDESTDITSDVSIKGSELHIPGELLSKIGLSAATKGDVSEPGLLLAVDF
jgi:hypothetical protein